MTMILAGDIGGTKTILRLVDTETSSKENIAPQLITLYQQSYSSQQFKDIVPIVQQFYAEAQQHLDREISVKNACFGIAGPVVNNTSELTNLSWSLSGDRLQKELSLNQVSLINDFAAIGYGILGLTKDDLYTLQDVKANPKYPLAILGAGTGLGEGFLIPLPKGKYGVFSSEGSHADFAPRTPLEFALLSYIQEKYQLSRVSVERVVSGLGITAIYQFLRQEHPEQESPTLRQIYHTWEMEKTLDLSAEVSKAALEKDDVLCQETMKIFVKAYGAEAGNLALKLLPYGGLYVAGGIAAKILPLMKNGDFMEAFLCKGRMRYLLSQIPVHIILNPDIGLIGAALRAAE